VGLQGWFVSWYFDRFWIIKFCFGLNHILRKIEQDWARSPCGSDGKGLLNGMRQFFNLGDEVIVFGARSCNSNNVGLLKGVISN